MAAHGGHFLHGGWRWCSGCGEKFGPKSKNHDREEKGRMVKNGSRRMAVAHTSYMLQIE